IPWHSGNSAQGRPSRAPSAQAAGLSCALRGGARRRCERVSSPYGRRRIDRLPGLAAHTRHWPTRRDRPVLIHRLSDVPAGDHHRFVNLVNDMPSALAVDTTALANQLRPVLLKLNRELRREIHSLGVTGGQVSLLVAIKQTPGIGVRELAAQERMSVPGMSKFVTRLEEAGLVKAE